MALTSGRCQSNGNDHLSNNQHDFKGWGENQRIMLRDKTWFYDVYPSCKTVPDHPCKLGLQLNYFWVRRTWLGAAIYPPPARIAFLAGADPYISTDQLVVRQERHKRLLGGLVAHCGQRVSVGLVQTPVSRFVPAFQICAALRRQETAKFRVTGSVALFGDFDTWLTADVANHN